MKLNVQRQIKTVNSIVGALTIDGNFQCFTLEPREDQSKGKPFCIPAGTYKGILQMSAHFGRATPHLLDVPGFTDIEIHPGNFPRDTHGCTLVGRVYNAAKPDMVGESVLAFNELMAKLDTMFEITYS